MCSEFVCYITFCKDCTDAFNACISHTHTHTSCINLYPLLFTKPHILWKVCINLSNVNLIFDSPIFNEIFEVSWGSYNLVVRLSNLLYKLW